MIDPLIDLPVDLQERYAAWSFDEVYHHTPGRATYRLDGVEETRFVKIVPSSLERVLADEAARLRWAAPWLPVPAMVEHGNDGELAWLMTTALPGIDASAHPWRVDDPDRLATVLGAALRRWHDSVPVRECPFDFTVHSALAFAAARVADGLVELHPDHGPLTPAEALARLRASAPAAEDLVVCHGDFCLPNVLLTDGEATGLVDVRGLGIADRWWDVATGAASVTYNCGPGHEGAFFAAYGVVPDPDRISWYRLLYDLAY